MIFCVIARRLVEPQAVEAALANMRRNPVPECDHKVFRRGDHPPKEAHIDIEIPVIAEVHHSLVDYLLQFTQVDDIAGLGIGPPADGHLQDIIVPMAVGKVAQTESALVPATGAGRIVQPVARVEMDLARHTDFAGLGASRGPAQSTGPSRWPRHGGHRSGTHNPIMTRVNRSSTGNSVALAAADIEN